MIIDTHCHLYTKEFSDDIDQVMERASAIGVSKFFLPAIDSETSAAMVDLENRFPGKCHAMAGLHPCSVKENYVDELSKIEIILTQRKFAAIGETGLDFYWDKTYEKEQYLALEKQIALALRYQLPIVLHTRNAMQQTIDVIKKYSGTGLTGIFHCFGGSLNEARQIIDEGFLLGIGGVITYKNAGLAEVIKEIDIAHLVLETDAPYLAPVPYRGKRNESAYLNIIAEKIAAVKNISTEEIAVVTTANAMKIFSSVSSL